uniref:Uncharacterized protein n=1 Tax=Nelumbo nucifera TaxID=4432 RepID=A0A822YX71_NELNU|nr:TPA_asm: hypothetical protein HUJ06_007778 [Nelumbo nucifera]
MVTINYKILGWELDEHLGFLGCENDVMVMFSTHGDLCEIMLYITCTEAKCISMNDGCSGKGKDQLQDDDDDDVDCYVVDVEGGVANDGHDHDEGIWNVMMMLMMYMVIMMLTMGNFEGLYDD